MTIQPGMSIAQALRKAKGEVVTLQPGRYEGFALYGLLSPIRLVGPGAVIEGGKGIKLEDCANVSLEGLQLLGNSSFGVMVVNCESAVLKGLNCSKNKKNGILTANTSNVTVEGCICDENGDQHGIYLSQSGDNLKVLNCITRKNGRAGIQINAVEPNRKPKDPKKDAISKGVEIRGNVLAGNQRLGAAALNLAGCREVVILENRVEGHLGRHGFALWDDGTSNAELACHNVYIAGNRFGFAPGKGVACISVGGSCSNVGVKSNNVFVQGLKMVDGPFEWR